jgi:predicted nucleic acid-binding protein
MANEIFVDTSGFYALLVKRDDHHGAADRILGDARRRKRGFVTTDYVLDETATLLKGRGHEHLLGRFFDAVLGSRVCRIEWTGAEQFHETKDYFLKHADQEWSFTDCMSFRTMRSLRLRDALTKDAHFQESGFNVLLK